MFELDLDALKKMGAHITTTEIGQQPELWLETWDIYQQNKNAISTFLEGCKIEGRHVRVVFTGAGTSAYVGDTVAPYLTSAGDTTHFDFEPIATTNIVSNPLDFLHPDDPTILVSFARSGNSPESVATVERAEQVVKNLKQITITCAPEGKLAKKAEDEDDNLLLLMPARSNDQGFAMTGSFSCMSLMAMLVFDQASDDQKHAWVEAISRMGKNVVAREGEVAKWLAGDYARIVYLGSGALAGLTREAQLKVLELTHGQIATCFDSSMGFRHGPKSFVDGTTLVFDFVSNDPYTRQYDLDILNEIAGDKICQHVVAVQQDKGEQFTGEAFTFAGEDALPEGYLALPYVMVAQTVSLLSSVKIGNTPDTPSPSGTVNRVVKGVTIHPFEY